MPTFIPKLFSPCHNWYTSIWHKGYGVVLGPYMVVFYLKLVWKQSDSLQYRDEWQTLAALGSHQPSWMTQPASGQGQRPPSLTFVLSKIRTMQKNAVSSLNHETSKSGKQASFYVQVHLPKLLSSNWFIPFLPCPDIGILCLLTHSTKIQSFVEDLGHDNNNC